MNSELPEQLHPDLLNEFYAECDELLAMMRGRITSLQHAQSVADRAVEIEELFRAAHTLKGNCGIVGIDAAEGVAHALEALIRAVDRGQLALSDALLDSMFLGVEQLWEFLTAHRNRTALPDLGLLMAAWQRFGSSHPSADDSRDPTTLGGGLLPPRDTNASFASDDDAVWICTFAPSSALQAQGIGIESVKARLAEMGEVLTCQPVIDSDKGLNFRLSVRMTPARWREGRELWARLGLVFDTVAAETEPALPPLSEESMPAQPLTESDTHLSSFVRVGLPQLDELMRLASEIMTYRGRLSSRLQEHFHGNDDLKHLDYSLGRSVRALCATVNQVRLVPISEIFSRIPYAIRELTRSGTADVRLRIQGDNIEIDKHLVDRLREPVMHLVRNAVAHAFEPSVDRVKQGKSAPGNILLRAKRTADLLEISVSDDGKGIDPSEVMRRASELGLPALPDEDPSSLLRTLCLPGFSTREFADRVSGRGVGMAIVDRTMMDLGGRLGLSTVLGAGTEFTLRVPLHLSILEGMIVKAGGHLCAVPQSGVDQIVSVDTSSVRAIGTREFLHWRDTLLPLVRLRTFLGASPGTGQQLIVLVIVAGDSKFGLGVDSVQGRKEFVISSFRDPLVRVPGISGATDLGDGRPVLVLAPEFLCPRTDVSDPAVELKSPPNDHAHRAL